MTDMKQKGKKDHRKSNLTRRQGVRDVKQSFLIVCEGERTEPEYFNGFCLNLSISLFNRQICHVLYIINVQIIYSSVQFLYFV